jgi:MuDR family transposase
MSTALAVGMTFPSLNAAKDALLRHTVERGESYFTHKRAANCFITKCRSEDCSYRICFTLKKGEDWTITVYTEHTCSPDTHRGWKPAQSVQYLAPNHTAAFSIDHTIKPSQICNIELQNGNQVSYKQSWRALKKIEQQILGDEAECFKKISFFLEHLSQADSQAYW